VHVGLILYQNKQHEISIEFSFYMTIPVHQKERVQLDQCTILPESCEAHVKNSKFLHKKILLGKKCRWVWYTRVCKITGDILSGVPKSYVFLSDGFG